MICKVLRRAADERTHPFGPTDSQTNPVMMLMLRVQGLDYDFFLVKFFSLSPFTDGITHV